MSEPATPTATTVAILAAMNDLGPADARTIAEHAKVGYSTAVRKLREWGDKGEVCKIDRGSEPAHWSLLPTDQPLPDHLHPAIPDTEPEATDLSSGQVPEPDAGPADEHPATDDTGIDDTDGDTPAAAHAGDARDDGDDHAAEDTDGQTAAAGSPTTEPDAEATTGGQPEPEASTPPDTGDLTTPTATPPSSAQDSDVATPDGEPAEAAAAARTAQPARRPKDYFHDEGLAILRANPDRELKVGELAKLIAAKEIAAGAPFGTKVSVGALSNALHKAAAAGEILLTRETPPATFRAA